MFRPLFVCLSFVALAFATPAVFADRPESTCAKHLTLVVDKLFAPVVQVYADVEHDTSWIYWGRLGTVFAGLNPDSVHSVFSTVNRDDFVAMIDALRAGVIRIEKASQAKMIDRFLQDLWDFGIVDTNGVFWREQDKEKRLAMIRVALDDMDTRHGHTARLENIGDRTENAVEVAEASLLTRATHETTRRQGREVRPKYKPMYTMLGMRMDWLIRFLWPVYPVVQTIVEFTNAIRERMQHAFLIDRVVVDAALNRKEELKFTAEELSLLHYLLANTGEQVADARADIAEAFGFELSVRRGVSADDLHYYRIAENLTRYNGKGEYARDQLAGERDLDRMHDTINQARARLGMSPRLHDDYTPNELRFRHMQYEREMRNTQRVHYSALARATDTRFTVFYSWSVTHTETWQVRTGTDKDGKAEYSTRWDSWTTYHDDSVTRSPSYRDVLTDTYDQSAGATHSGIAFPRHGGSVSSVASSPSVDRIQGLEEIRAATRDVRKSERPYWEKFEAQQKRLVGLIAAHADALAKGTTEKGYLDSLRATIRAQRNVVEQAMNQFIPYSEMTAPQIRRQWSDDDRNDYRARNRALVARYANLIHYSDVYEEQLRRRDPQLIIVYETPDHTAALEPMRRRMIRDYWIKGVAAVTAVAGAIGTAVWFSQSPPPPQYVPPAPVPEVHQADNVQPPMVKPADFGMPDDEK